VTSEEVMLTIEEAASICAVSKDVVRRAIRRSDLPAFKVFNRVRIKRSDLDEYIEQRRIGGRDVARRRRRATSRSDEPRGSLQALNRKLQR
jgi:excisionase family DNA binding protein